MSKIAKFLENELDRVNEYLSMAKSKLQLIQDLCEDKCSRITSDLSDIDKNVIEYLDKKISLLDAKISNSKEIIYDFKKYYFEETINN